MTVLNTPLKLNIRQQIKSLCAVSVLLAEIHSDEVTYKFIRKHLCRSLLLIKLQGIQKKWDQDPGVGPGPSNLWWEPGVRPCVRPRGGTLEWDLEVGPWGVTLG